MLFKLLLTKILSLLQSLNAWFYSTVYTNLVSYVNAFILHASVWLVSLSQQPLHILLGGFFTCLAGLIALAFFWPTESGLNEKGLDIDLAAVERELAELEGLINELTTETESVRAKGNLRSQEQKEEDSFDEDSDDGHSATKDKDL